MFSWGILLSKGTNSITSDVLVALKQDSPLAEAVLRSFHLYTKVFVLVGTAQVVL